ncbi:MAG: hypothetical protein HY076_05665 [Candidatus Eisenbacteria bacterium]|uniref:DUF3619 family protein n=1 Tax=Eiseniibacteriota bacterium TaxID=2212470 RepID=A0A9D6L6L6_UNCEI|nr:hypothetical protein [Candidatus Eisenbacteria bacterium]MBI3539741.1 hypothetical protein [Candidatus Eisenbacteria bacterium]
MTIDHDDDPRLTRLLTAVRADAEPALWTRVRARAEARRPVGGPLAWIMRPAALAASFAILLGTAALALTLGDTRSASGGDEYATLGEALVAERAADVTPATSVPAPARSAAGDSGTRE